MGSDLAVLREAMAAMDELTAEIVKRERVSNNAHIYTASKVVLTMMVVIPLSVAALIIRAVLK